MFAATTSTAITCDSRSSPVTIDCKRLCRFLFPKQTDEWLVVFRVGLGIELALYCLSARFGWVLFFSSNCGALLAGRVLGGFITFGNLFFPPLHFFFILL